MKVSYKWLQEYVDIKISAEELAEKLTLAGIAVEGIEYRAAEISGVIVAKVLERVAHPKSDHLSICQVDTGHGVLTVVCGAPNVATGQTVALAAPGATLPHGVKIGLATLAGVESSGMLCSAAELGIDETAGGGIWVLPNDLPLGADLVETLALKDIVLELELTPNRSDCLAVINVAREVAAVTGSRCILPNLYYEKKGAAVENLAGVNVVATDLCPRYTARLVHNVQLGASPLWMQNYLLAAGMRPINNIVDIANFVMLETGCPLHTFDYDALADHKIIVRRAQDGEKMVTLDGKERTYDHDTLMICDALKPICIAGVMGGLETEVTAKTVNVLIEAAKFDSQNIRHTSKKLGLSSEASLRFEKCVDVQNLDFASKRAVQLMVELAGGTAASGVINICNQEYKELKVILRQDKVNSVLGTRYSLDEIAQVMESLCFPVQRDGNGLLVSVPSYRPDITIEEDLIEEVARLKGYDKIPLTLPLNSSQGGKTTKQILEDRLRNTCVSLGLAEVINYSFISPKDNQRLRLDDDHVLRGNLQILNPLTEEQSIMRKTLLAGLLGTAQRNFNRRNTNLSLFEYGTLFFPQGDVLPVERPALGVFCLGETAAGWLGNVLPYDFYYIKGVFENIMAQFNIVNYTLEVPDAQYPYLHPGRSCVMKINGEYLGFMGELHPSVMENYDLDGRGSTMELMADVLYQYADLMPDCQDLPKYPAGNRDIAIVVKAAISAAEIESAIKEKGGPCLRKVELFDVYDKPPIPVGERSLAYNLIFQNTERTLTDDEVNTAFNDILEYLQQKFAAKLR